MLPTAAESGERIAGLAPVKFPSDPEIRAV
ncbi:MAG: hypothetical protein HLUCCO16_08255 [Phormidium sp. OSCR]|nr:MAG: hypothetical protein HLUCCO16_08255 [Phormidium sp. OSCR]